MRIYRSVIGLIMIIPVGYSQVLAGIVSKFDEPENIILLPNVSLFTDSFAPRSKSMAPAGISISTVPKELLEIITGIKEPRADLQLNNFMFNPLTSERKYQLNFEIPEKGSLSIKILDSSLQELFKEKMCDFDHKYSKSLPLPEKDTYYISVNYNDDWFVRKLVVD